MIHDVTCECGKTATGTVPELRHVGWSWSAVFCKFLCRECFEGVVAITVARGARHALKRFTKLT